MGNVQSAVENSVSKSSDVCDLAENDLGKSISEISCGRQTFYLVRKVSYFETDCLVSIVCLSLALDA